MADEDDKIVQGPKGKPDLVKTAREQIAKVRRDSFQQKIKAKVEIEEKLIESQRLNQKELAKVKQEIEELVKDFEEG